MIQDKIKSIEDICALREQFRVQKKKVVFTNGCFDILHRGHVLYLEEAKGCGDILIVALNTDASVQKLKGPTRPINSEQDRMTVIASLATVDFVCVFDEADPRDIISKLKPDVHVKAGDYKAEDMIETPIVIANGGVVKIVPFHSGYSTTRIIEKMK